MKAWHEQKVHLDLISGGYSAFLWKVEDRLKVETKAQLIQTIWDLFPELRKEVGWRKKDLQKQTSFVLAVILEQI